MPKATQKRKAVNDGEEELVVGYLEAQNRPYSATDIFNNLHGQVGKTLLVKILTDLVEKGLVNQKAYGKQVVYVIPQTTEGTPTPEELEELDEQISSLKKKAEDAKNELRESNSILSKLLEEPSDTSVLEEISFLEEENSRLRKKTEASSTNTATMRKVDPVEKEIVDKEFIYLSKELLLRKKKCKQILSSITENLPIPPKQFMEDLGIAGNI